MFFSCIITFLVSWFVQIQLYKNQLNMKKYTVPTTSCYFLTPEKGMRKFLPLFVEEEFLRNKALQMSSSYNAGSKPDKLGRRFMAL